MKKGRDTDLRAEDGDIVMEYYDEKNKCTVRVNNAYYKNITPEENQRRIDECRAVAWGLAVRLEMRCREAEARGEKVELKGLDDEI